MPPGLDGKYATGRRRPNLFRPARRKFALPISIIILGLLIALFAVVQPSTFLENPPDVNKIKVPTVTPSPTPLPPPTDVHGGHIVFTCMRKEINQICIISADGSNYQQLTDNSTNTYYPAISPDGQSIVYAVNQYDNFDLFTLPVPGSNSKSDPIRLTDNIGNAFSPSFSPDGQQIVFVNKTSDGKSGLWLMSSTGENPHAIYTGAGNIVVAAWSHDGRTIAFAMSVTDQFSYEIFLLDLQNPNSPRQLSHDLSDIGGSISWSPDGKNILIYAGPVMAREIYRLDTATGAATQLTDGGNNAAAAYSPDGQWIVYNSLRNNSQADLYIMRFDGHSTRQLTSFPEPDWQPQWGP
jgi:TolB protein